MPSGKPREATIVNAVRLACSTESCRLFRNNVGMLFDRDGRAVRYGLCVGSSDLIGWRTVTITADMVGSQLAQFVALEVKRPGEQPTGEQVRFIKAVTAAGGKAGVVTSAEQALEMIEGQAQG